MYCVFPIIQHDVYFTTCKVKRLRKDTHQWFLPVSKAAMNYRMLEPLTGSGFKRAGTVDQIQRTESVEKHMTKK